MVKINDSVINHKEEKLFSLVDASQHKCFKMFGKIKLN